ncbi:PAS domain-containing protein [Isachenkonia alkalipeptolytica]|uniref:histidine kinase n=1 Tax=Isachenkonia alkalipeptolytica TaxID=2565777 RepID=A0AA43XLE6_9CLOT|nr:PAS domain-containing protein [Isachenkonia alkalipeptolytica]NBG88389.1 hypothetical protein [Isachenkonia alkalipeptolytica]
MRELTRNKANEKQSPMEDFSREELEIRYQQSLLDLQNAEDLNRKYQLILEEVNDGYWELDMIRDEFTLRSKYYRSHGVIPTLIIQRKEKWQQLIHPEDRENFHQALEAFLNSEKKFFKFSHRLKTRDDEYQWVLATGFGLRDEMKAPKRIIGTHMTLSDKGKSSGQEK